MAYTKTTWATDDIITASGLNNIENGIYGVANYTNATISTGTPLSTYINTSDLTFTARKQGNIVVVTFAGYPKATIPKFYSFARLPEGYRPQENMFFIGYYYGSGVTLGLYLTTDGYIQCYSQEITGTNRMVFNIAYITA